jgi:hypothetical protein
VDHIPREMGKAGVLRMILASFSVIFGEGVKLGIFTTVSQPFVFLLQVSFYFTIKDTDMPAT